jgi:hypothetical protein
MKTISKFLAISLLAVACCVSLGFSVARADENDDEQGGEIEGTESLDVEIAMTPTAAAPAGSSIQLSLEAEDDEGTTQATLKLETQGLPAGTYSVSVTLKSDGSTVALGSFTVSSGDDEDNQGDDDSQGDEDQGNNEVVFGGEEGIPFPANFNPMDIAMVSVADASGVVLFTADLTTLSSTASMNLNANVQAVSGPGDPGAAGNAVLTAFAKRGATKGSLQLSGRGLPPSSALMVAVNGISAKKANSDKSGNVNVMLKPKGKTGTVAPGVNLSRVSSISLHDQFGNVLLSAKF